MCGYCKKKRGISRRIVSRNMASQIRSRLYGIYIWCASAKIIYSPSNFCDKSCWAFVNILVFQEINTVQNVFLKGNIFIFVDFELPSVPVWHWYDRSCVHKAHWNHETTTVLKSRVAELFSGLLFNHTSPVIICHWNFISH